MTDKFTDRLDVALARLRAGEPAATILADYPADVDSLRPLLEAAASLEWVRAVELPAPEALAADRTAFLTEVTHWQQQAVSTGHVIRLKERLPWSLLNFLTSGRSQRRMSALLVKAMLVIGLVFGAAGSTAAMAANSLPDSPLYPVKLAMEDARLAVTDDPAAQARLHLALAEERTQEMEKVALKGGTPGEATLTRLQNHLEVALQLASQLPDEEMNGVLTQARQMTQSQLQQMSQTMARLSQSGQEPLHQASQFLNRVGQDAEAGLQDPLTFRHRFGNNRPEENPVQPTREPGLNRANAVPTDEPQPTDEPAPTVEPPATVEPTTEPPADSPCPDCEPAGDQHQYGQNSDTIPPCPEPGTCVPVGDEHKYQEPGPHGDQCQDGSDCIPAGDENRYGQENSQSAGPQDDTNANCSESGNCDPGGSKERQGQPAEVDDSQENPDDLNGNEPPAEPANSGSAGESSGGDSGSSGGGGGGNGGGGKK